MEVKPGYKLTDIGVFPVDWEVNSLLCVFQPKQGLQFPVEQQHTVQKVGFIKFIRIIDVTQSNEDPRYVVDPGHQHQIHEEDIFMVRYGSPGLLGIGYCGVIANNMFRLIPRQPMNRLFFYYLLQSKQAQIIQLSSSTTMAAVNFNSLRSLFVGYPCSLQEQDAIATILSNIDSLITSLEKLIEKKKNIKQGVMQDLLTGIRRLQGFDKGWETKKLNSLCSCITTGRKDVNEGNPNGKYPFFTCSRSITFSDQYSFDSEAILIAGNGDVGTLHYYKGKFEAYQRTYVLSGFGIPAKYLVHYLNYSLIPALNENKIGSSIPYIKIGDLTDLLINTPREQSEIIAIVNVLDDMDCEIGALSLQLEKCKNLKDGMMQELLTGRIRLL